LIIEFSISLIVSAGIKDKILFLFYCCCYPLLSFHKCVSLQWSCIRILLGKRYTRCDYECYGISI